MRKSLPRLLPSSFNHREFVIPLLKTPLPVSRFNQLLCYAFTSNLCSDPFISSQLLHHSLTSHSNFSYALSLFSQIPNPNIYSFNFLFKSLSLSTSPSMALSLFDSMRMDPDLSPDNYTFLYLLKVCGRLGNVKKGEEIHGLSFKLGFENDVFVQNGLINMYCSFGMVGIAHRVFDNMPELVCDVVSYNSMMSGHLQCGSYWDVLKVFGGRRREGGVERLDEVSLVGAISACSKTGLVQQGRMIHGLVITGEFVMDVYLTSSLIDLYAKSGRMDDARRVFDGFEERNVVCWTSMIGGYAQCDMLKEAIELFREMQGQGVRADPAVVACLASACGHSGALDQGRWIHAYCERNFVAMNLVVRNAFIDMYSKCGDVDKALEMFLELDNRDVFSWTAMISGLAMNGESDKALQLFSQMEKSSFVRPNEVTFLGVLSACSHGGFVDKAFYYLEEMSRTYNLAPHIGHYGCMVDLLGRANLLVDALKFIVTLPVQPDVVMWRSLLFACRSHGNIELAEYAADQVEKLEPTRCGARILLSNAYASTFRWSDVKRVRENMTLQGILKQPGCSFVEVDGIVHEFYVKDQEHSEIDLVYDTIDGINRILLDEGFNPDNLDCHHSSLNDYVNSHCS